MSPLRLMFASIHGYIDFANGASTATRDLLELLAGRGHDCRVLSTGVLDYKQETTISEVVSKLNTPFSSVQANLSNNETVAVLDLQLRGVRVTLLPTESSRVERSPTLAESLVFLDLAEQHFEQFKPHVLLTYGGDPTGVELMRRAKRRGIPVIFHLHNFAYPSITTFADTSAVLVPTEHSRRYHAQQLGLDCTAIDLPLNLERIQASNPAPQYLTYVNPVPAKGVTVFARIASELARRRPDIPLLVVEGRETADWVSKAGLDLTGLSNLTIMANTPNPRDFWRVSRAVLMPSLWRENAALVAREALINGLPVLASDRGGLPETLGEAGFVFTIPAKCTPSSGEVPSLREVMPWIATIERLWDDSEWEAMHRMRAIEAAKRWNNDQLIDKYEKLFRKFVSRHCQIN